MSFAFKCDRCGTVYTDVKELNNPYYIGDGPRLYKWDLCDKCMCEFREFMGNNARKIVIGVDPVVSIPFKCDRCGKTHTKVHHTVYDDVVVESRHTLWEICEDCIRAFKNFLGDGGYKIRIDDKFGG